MAYNNISLGDYEVLIETKTTEAQLMVEDLSGKNIFER